MDANKFDALLASINFDEMSNEQKDKFMSHVRRNVPHVCGMIQTRNELNSLLADYNKPPLTDDEWKQYVEFMEARAKHNDGNMLYKDSVDALEDIRPYYYEDESDSESEADE